MYYGMQIWTPENEVKIGLSDLKMKSGQGLKVQSAPVIENNQTESKNDYMYSMIYGAILCQ